LATDFNLMELIATKEENISRVIAKLLDPRGGHGQGSVFLQKFLERIFPQRETFRNLETSKVLTEYTIPNGRRIDILVVLPDGFSIGIENRPRAGDQENQ
jgi:hypothetical protein